MGWDQKRRPPSEYLHPAKRQRILYAHAGICHTCGHPDADQVDHVIAWAEWTRTDLSVHDASNLAPIHEYCSTCDVRCHEVKTNAEAARGRARGNERRKAQAVRPREQHPGSISHT